MTASDTSSTASNFATRILVETDRVVAWNKPAGLATTGRDLDDPDCAQHLAMQHYDRMIWAIHQLDRDTSGVVLFARRKQTVAQWQQRWNTPAVRKYYAAMVHGRPDDSPVSVEAPLKRHDRRGYTEVTVNESGKSAKTTVWTLDHSDHYSLIIARPHTGRTHQIRVHLQHIGCPLIGEERYNAIPCGYHHRHALHALALCTDRPAPLQRITAPVADDLYDPATRLGLNLDRLDDWMERLNNGEPSR